MLTNFDLPTVAKIKHFIFNYYLVFSHFNMDNLTYFTN